MITPTPVIRLSAILLSLAPASLAIAAPAHAADRNYSVTGFDRIRIDGPFRVRLATGVAPFARASGPAQGLESVALDVQGRTLVIRPNRSSWGGYPGQPGGPVDITVGTHDLSAAWVNGSGSLAIDAAKGLSFDLSLQGSGAVAVGRLAVDQLKVAISGAGSVTLSGAAPRMSAVVRGASSLDASGLSVKDAVIGAQGPALVRAQVSNSAKVDAMGTAEVQISGSPACTANAVGSAAITGCR